MFRPVTLLKGALVLGGILLVVVVAHHLLNFLERVGLALEVTFTVLVGVMVHECVADHAESERVPILGLTLVLLFLCLAAELGDGNISDALDSAFLLHGLFWLCGGHSLLLPAKAGAAGDAGERFIVVSGWCIVLDLDILDILFRAILGSVYTVLGGWERVAAVVLDCFSRRVFPF